ncbi:sulfotransferase domain-containing protein [Desulfothermus okinawensis]
MIMLSLKNIRDDVENLKIRTVVKLNYYLKNYNDIIWLIGDGRSGTTWVCNLINFSKKYRVMFEPFHPKFVSRANFLIPHQYVCPGKLDDNLIRFARDVFSGNFFHRRVDSENTKILYEGILIKDIFANLFSYALMCHFPEVKPILLIRNPFAVALSKFKKKNWFWFNEPRDLLKQTDLYIDHLSKFEDLILEISEKRNFLLNQILIWCIINYIPLRQFKLGTIYVCFYENIYSDPIKEIKKIFKFIKKSHIIINEIKLNEAINRPSRVAGEDSCFFTGKSPISSWKDEIPTEIIEKGLYILQHFGFEKLYKENFYPDENMLIKIQASV